MEQDLLHQVIAGGQVFVQRGPLSDQVGAHIVLFRRIEGVHPDGPVHQVAVHEQGQFFLAVGVGVQLAQQAGEQPQVMDILLGQRAGIEVDVRLAHAVHAGHGVQTAHAVLTGLV